MFLNENDPEKRQKILGVVPEETARALEAQWILRQEEIRAAEGESEGLPAQGGRLVTQEGLKAWKSARTDLNYGDFQRSEEIAEFFARRGYQLPDSDSELWSGILDYEDVKLKIIEQEGYDQVSRSRRSQKTSRAGASPRPRLKGKAGASGSRVDEQRANGRPVRRPVGQAKIFPL